MSVPFNVRLRCVSFLSVALALSDSFAADTERLLLPYGVTRKSTSLVADVDRSLLDVDSNLTRVLIVAGAETQADAAVATTALAQKLCADAGRNWRAGFNGVSVSVVASPFPEGVNVAPEFPATGKAYDDLQQPEAIYLWRSIGMWAPDVVIEIRARDQLTWSVPKSPKVDLKFAEALAPHSESAMGSLGTALSRHAACDVAPIPAIAVHARSVDDLTPIMQLISGRKSPARLELQRRRKRTPIDVAQELSLTYGQQLNDVAYIPALSLVGRLRLGQLTRDESHLRAVKRIVKPYHSGEKPALTPKASGSQHAGHLVFGELADLTQDRRYVELVKQVADLGFDAQGRALDAMPSHSEMSDAVFMGTPILAQAARLSGEAKYREMALKHLRFMMRLNQRADGLHQHSPVAPDKSAWGRGNGFVALGLTLTLSELPAESPEALEVLQLYRQHVTAMKPLQDELGMWHQVVDHPESYREFTVTCMTTFAMVRGMRRGWLDRTAYEPVVRRAWSSIKQRIGANGSLVDVCTGTGKMKSLREYLDRPATLGKDDRGGAMAFLVSTEIAAAEVEGKLSLGAATR